MKSIDSNTLDVQIGHRLHSMREELSMKAVEMSMSIGMSKSQYSMVENGKKGLTRIQLVQLWETHGADIHWVITGKGDWKWDRKDVGDVEDDLYSRLQPVSPAINASNAKAYEDFYNATGPDKLNSEETTHQGNAEPSYYDHVVLHLLTAMVTNKSYTLFIDGEDVPAYRATPEARAKEAHAQARALIDAKRDN